VALALLALIFHQDIAETADASIDDEGNRGRDAPNTDYQNEVGWQFDHMIHPEVK
jgi:hypothetical protein